MKRNFHVPFLGGWGAATPCWLPDRREPYPMKVFVLSHTGKPLMPTTPRRARLWLTAKRARVVRRDPFTIQLCFETTTYNQPVRVGVDTGSQAVGIAATANQEVVFQAEMHLRTDVSRKLAQRRQYRRARRSRKTRYRAARWANRRRSPGWLPPSLRSKAEATVKAVCFGASFLPVSQLKVEIASFDTHKMQNPEIEGIHYQQGQLEGYQLREYLLCKLSILCRNPGEEVIEQQTSPWPVSRAIAKREPGPQPSLAFQRCRRRHGCRSRMQPTFPA